MTANITCVNDAPVADDETVTATEDTALDTPVDDVARWRHHTDVDGGTVTVVSVAHGRTGTVIANGSRSDLQAG